MERKMDRSLFVLGRGLACWVALAVFVAAGCGDDDGGGRNAPSAIRLRGPITLGVRGFPGTSTPVDLAAHGYVEEEFFVEGEATSYTAAGRLTSDGAWTVEPEQTAPFTTRILIRRPADQNRADGTILVEWFNVSSLVDIDIDFGFAAEEILRGGYVWVGVSAQQAGITSTGGSPFGATAVGLQAWDAERYAALDHPGDPYSYDIFSQVGRLLGSPAGREALGGIAARRLIAAGESQSAFRMLTYVNAVHPVAQVYDGFLIHSRDGGGAPLTDAPQTAVPAIARIRTDLREPVLQLATETDLFELRPDSPFPDARQADTDRIRTWEMAGTAHSDAFYLSALYEQGLLQFGSFLDLRPVIPLANDGPQTYLVRAAIRHLRDWVRDGTAPPTAEPISVSGGSIVRDTFGNALGGVRTPLVDVPVATLTGEGFNLIGMTIPLDPEILRMLYPSRADYLREFEEASRAAMIAGFVLADDLEELLGEVGTMQSFN